MKNGRIEKFPKREALSNNIFDDLEAGPLDPWRRLVSFFNQKKVYNNKVIFSEKKD